MFDETRGAQAALRVAYSETITEERQAWIQYRDASLGEDERAGAYARWRVAADELLKLAHELRDTPGP